MPHMFTSCCSALIKAVFNTPSAFVKIRLCHKKLSVTCLQHSLMRTYNSVGLLQVFTVCCSAVVRAVVQIPSEHRLGSATGQHSSS